MIFSVLFTAISVIFSVVLYFASAVITSPVFIIQDRSDVARKIISAIRKKKGEMIRGIERLCDAYISLAYMDASKHKTEKSE